MSSSNENKFSSQRRNNNSATIAVRTGIDTDSQFGAVVSPLHLSANYTFAGFEKKRRYDYTRSGNPTRDQLAETLSSLEGGYGGVVTNTGMSAVLLATSLLSPRDLLVAPHDCYGGSYRLFETLSKKGNFEVLFVDQTNLSELDKALTKKPKLVWLETPSNPLLRIVDIKEISKKAHAVGALVAADNTFLSPANQRPIGLGADIVIHSTTKYINGHSDVVGGAAIAANKEIAEQLAWWANCLGLTGAPFDSYLTLRGLRTLFPRIKLQEKNAAALAKLLQQHSAISRVYYPGLPEHPGHEIAKSQQDGFGAMISFELKGGAKSVEALVGNLKLFSLAESLGGVESLVAHPATMTHASMTKEAREVAGITEGLVRISVGIEDLEDLGRDLGDGLDGVGLR